MWLGVVCLGEFHGMGHQQQQGAMLTGVVYAIVAAQLMKMICLSSSHQATNTADIDSASSLYHDYVSLHLNTLFSHPRLPPSSAAWVVTAASVTADGSESRPDISPWPPERRRRTCGRPAASCVDILNRRQNPALGHKRCFNVATAQA